MNDETVRAVRSFTSLGQFKVYFALRPIIPLYVAVEKCDHDGDVFSYLI